MSGDEKTHYEVLGVASDASPVEIKKAARRLMQTHHPDRGGDEAVAASINTAFGVLSSPAKREEYDEFLRSGGESTEPEAPDPDSYEDEWGTADEWTDIDEEEELDVEVEEDTPGPPTPPPSEPPEHQDAPDGTSPAPETDSSRPTKVRTALQRALFLGLLPAVLLNLAVFGESYIITAADSWTLFPAIGAAVGLLVPLVLRSRLPQAPSAQTSIATLTANVFLVVALAFIAPGNPLVIPALQTLIATSLGIWVLVANAAHHRLAERVISSQGLREDGTLFGPSTGDTSGELLTSTLWNCLARPEMHAARAFQTADAENHFTKALLLGDRVALLRPVFIPDSLIPSHSPAFYWSPPSLFLQSPTSGVPTPILRMDLADYRASFKRVAGQLTVAEFFVIYTTPTSPTISLPSENPLMPTITTGPESADAICKFLTGTKKPTHHVDHISAATTLMGLEYQLMNA